MLKGKALRTKVTALLDGGQTRTEVFEALKAEANEAELAKYIVRWADPELAKMEHKKILLLTTLIIVQIVVLLYYRVKSANYYIPQHLDEMIFTTLYISLLCWICYGIYKLKIAAYKAYAFVIFSNYQLLHAHHTQGLIVWLLIYGSMLSLTLLLQIRLFPFVSWLDFFSISPVSRYTPEKTRKYAFLFPPQLGNGNRNGPILPHGAFSETETRKGRCIMLKGKALRTKVTALLDGGQTRAEVFEALKGEALQTDLAKYIAQWADPVLVTQHKTKLETLAAVTVVLGLIAVPGLLIKTGTLTAFTLSLAVLVLAIQIWLAWKLYTPRAWAYMVSFFLTIMNLVQSHPFDKFSETPIASTIGLAIPFAYIVWVGYVANKVFPYMLITGSPLMARDKTYTFLAPPKA